jgi:hypothetical protein
VEVFRDAIECDGVDFSVLGEWGWDGRDEALDDGRGGVHWDLRRGRMMVRKKPVVRMVRVPTTMMRKSWNGLAMTESEEGQRFLLERTIQAMARRPAVTAEMAAVFATKPQLVQLRWPYLSTKSNPHTQLSSKSPFYKEVSTLC